MRVTGVFVSLRFVIKALLDLFWSVTAQRLITGIVELSRSRRPRTD